MPDSSQVWTLIFKLRVQIKWDRQMVLINRRQTDSSSWPQSYAEITATPAFVTCLLASHRIKELACERSVRLPFAALTGTLGVRPCAGKNKVPSKCTPHVSIWFSARVQDTTITRALNSPSDRLAISSVLNPEVLIYSFIWAIYLRLVAADRLYGMEP